MAEPQQLEVVVGGDWEGKGVAVVTTAQELYDAVMGAIAVNPSAICRVSAVKFLYDGEWRDVVVAPNQEPER